MEQTVLPGNPGGAVGQRRFDHLLDVLNAPGGLTVEAGGQSAELPDELRQLLLAALTTLASGTAVTLTPQRTQLTTQEAADILGISRPTLVRLLSEGEIPSTRPGRHRRIQLVDVLAYQQRIREQREDALDRLSAPEPTAPGPDGFTATR